MRHANGGIVHAAPLSGALHERRATTNCRRGFLRSVKQRSILVKNPWDHKNTKLRLRALQRTHERQTVLAVSLLALLLP